MYVCIWGSVYVDIELLETNHPSFFHDLFLAAILHIRCRRRYCSRLPDSMYLNKSENLFCEGRGKEDGSINSRDIELPR